METCQEKIIHHENVARAAALMPPPAVVQGLGDIFKALGEESRLRIVIALLSGELCVCDLASVCGMTESAVSHQLRILRNLKIVANRRDGKVVFYRIVHPLVQQTIQSCLDSRRPAPPEAALSGGNPGPSQGAIFSHATDL